MRTPEAVAAMACPVCKTALAMSERAGIEIDYCPTCRGVWLDRGELDKIIERSAASEMSEPLRAPQPPQPPQVPPPAAQQAPTPWGSDRPGYGNPGGGYGDRGYDNRGYDDRGYDDRRHSGDYRHKKRRKSFLEELFD